MLVVAFAQAGFAVAAVYYGARVAMRFGRDVRGAVFHRSLQLSAREVNQLGAASLITRATNDVQQVQLLVVMTCTTVLAAPITVIGGVVLALRQNTGMAWLLVVSMLVLAVALGLVIGRLVPQFRRMQERLDNANRVLREQITGMRVVRAFGREPHEAGRFRVVNEELAQTSLAAGRLLALMFPIVMLVINCANVAVIWFGANRIAHGQMAIGSLVAFLTYFTLILLAVMMSTFVAVMTPRAAVSAERIQEVLDTEPSVQPPSQPVTEFRTPGTLEFRRVSFGYPGADEPVVRDLSFRAEPGQTMAVIGSTGSGKDHPRQPGGSSLRHYRRDGARRRCRCARDRTGSAVAPHRAGAPAALPLQRHRRQQPALRRARRHRRGPVVGAASRPGGRFRRGHGRPRRSILQGGSNVSGGQRQRLSIARALVRRPDVYLFDDSFSALDLATEARLRAALTPYTSRSTVLVVAQRVSTIVNADQILVLEEGEAAGIGRHDELLERCPTYAEIVASQTRSQDAA